MRKSTNRILTTHTGSLPRPPELTKLLKDKDQGVLEDKAELSAAVRAATIEIAVRQSNAGVDIVNDGEMGKIGYATYVKDRLTGFEGKPSSHEILAPDIHDFPGFAARIGKRLAQAGMPITQTCVGPIEWKGADDVAEDVAILQAAISAVDAAEGFMTAASPGVIAQFLPNEYYPSYEEYLARLAEVMKQEYDAIHKGGFILQLDCPDMAAGRARQFRHLDTPQFIKMLELHVEAINHAVADIPSDRVRMHLCWGNYEGPHHHDVPLSEILPTIFKANVAGIVCEAANPRHAHEWAVFRDIRLPDDKVVIPGVLDTCTNYIEHPELIADRICNYASVVGRENVIAGTDCGFATFAGVHSVDPDIAWKKIEAMAEGARIATTRLW